MNLEDFDVIEEESAETPPTGITTSAEVERQQTEKIRLYRNARNLILSPEVAQALREGWSLREISDALGVSYQTVAKYAKSEEMSVLVEREARRVLRHLTTRELKDEKYRDLSVSLGVLIDKARLLRNEPTEIIREEQTSVATVANLLFGQPLSGAGSSGSGTIIEITPENGTECLPDLHEQAEPE